MNKQSLTTRLEAATGIKQGAHSTMDKAQAFGSNMKAKADQATTAAGNLKNKAESTAASGIKRTRSART